MKPTAARVTGAVVVLVLLIAIAVVGNRIFTRERLGPAGTEAPGEEPIGLEIRTLTLYFGARDSVALVAERRDLPSHSDLSGDLAETFDDLAAGPTSAASLALVPEGTRVRHVFVDGAGTVYVDFTGEFLTGMKGGLSEELMLIRSIARTLSVNYAGLSHLQILVDGRVVDVLGGHLDLSRPLPLSKWG